MDSAMIRTHSARSFRYSAGELVRGEQRRDEPRQARRAGEILEQPQVAQLLLDRQPVAGLRLGGRRPVRAHAREPRGGRAAKLLVRAGARRAHRRLDAAALRRDRRVALAGEPATDLDSAIAEPDRMRVRVDEARDDGAPAGVELLGGGPAGELAAVVGLGAGEDDAAVPRRGRRRRGCGRRSPGPGRAGPRFRAGWRGVPMFLTASEVEITGASDHAARAACCSQDAGLGVRRAFLRSDDAQELKPRTTGAPKNAGLTPSKAQAGLAECRFP
jgi:hypothetical protein